MEIINSVSDNVNLLEKQVNVSCTCSVVTGEPYCTEEWQVRVPPKIVFRNCAWNLDFSQLIIADKYRSGVYPTPTSPLEILDSLLIVITVLFFWRSILAVMEGEGLVCNRPWHLLWNTCTKSRPLRLPNIQVENYTFTICYRQINNAITISA